MKKLLSIVLALSTTIMSCSSCSFLRDNIFPNTNNSSQMDNITRLDMEKLAKNIDKFAQYDFSQNKVFGSAYISPDKKRIVQVYVNPTYKKHTVSAKVKNWGNIKKVQVFRTDQRNDLANTYADEKSTEITITPRSITTVVIDKE